MNLFGRRSTRFDEDEEEAFYPSEKENETLEEVADTSDNEVVTPVSSDMPNMGMGMGLGGSLELKVVHSEKYEEVPSVAEHLLNHCTVVLDLNDANKEVRRRILDFLSGVAFSIGGQMRRVTDNTYILTPSNVDVSESHVSAPVDEE